MSKSAQMFGMSRRHFLQHLAGASALVSPALALTQTLQANAATLRRRQRSAILLWMNGGPPTIDMWDLKPGTPTGGPLQPISTSGDMQISERLPLMAQQMHHLSVVRSMSTREADHSRGRYYMRTGFVPNPSVQHPSYGSVVAHEMADQLPELEIPPFISIGGASEGPGFLGMAYAPLEVDPSGNIRNLRSDVPHPRMMDRMALLASLEQRFIKDNPGTVAAEHAKVLDQALALMSSKQLAALQIDQEPAGIRQRYGDSQFARGCLMARRLVETGVPFVEVNFGGWDLHSQCFTALDRMLPELDQAMSALVEDLAQRGTLKDTIVLWMGEFGRTPRINGNNGRDHWARSWSVVLGGGDLQSGLAVGATSADGTRVESEPYSSEDLMATVCHGLGLSLKTTFTSKSGRPMKIANGGKLISELVT